MSCIWERTILLLDEGGMNMGQTTQNPLLNSAQNLSALLHLMVIYLMPSKVSEQISTNS